MPVTDRATETEPTESTGWPYDGPLTWAQVCEDASLNDLPYRIELDRYGRLLMSPVSTRHSRLQGRIARLLEDALGGEAFPECAVLTAEGVRPRRCAAPAKLPALATSTKTAMSLGWSLIAAAVP